MGSRHYASSKPVEWLRKKVFKVKKPRALGWGQWDKWDADLKKARPIAFFFTETLPEWVEWIPKHSIEYVDNVRCWCSNYAGNTHGLQSTLSKGKWHEFEKRVLYSNFDSFVDFIECEEAWNHIAWSDKEQSAPYKLPWHKRHWLTRWGKPWRCAQAGIDHLKWEMTLQEDGVYSHQAISAVEKMTLYTWWKDIRPARGSEWDESGFQAFWDAMDLKYGGHGEWLCFGSKSLTAAESKMYDELSAKNEELEKQHEEEDTEMLIRLMKIRSALWT